MSHAHQLPLLDADAARAGDAAAVAAGATWAGLMETAAGHLARGVIAATGRGYGLRVAILVGRGNNGGDGWAAARRLTRTYGASVWVIAPDGSQVATSEQAAAQRDAWIAGGGKVSSGTSDLEAALSWSDVAVDCLLGTGSSGPPRGPVATAIRALQTARDRKTTVVACDLPSGVSANDGRVAGLAVRADATITFGGLKRGLVLHPGATYAGTVTVGDLGRRYDPWAALTATAGAGSVWRVLTPAGAAPPRYDAQVDKRARGTVLVVAGASGTSGAAALAGSGALRAGAGLVTVATPAPVRAEVAAHHPALMVRGLTADATGAVGHDTVAELGDLSRMDAVVAGPGLGYGAGAVSLVTHLRAHARRLVLDADAINVHRNDPAALAEHPGELVITPHERELARMGGGSDGTDAWEHRVERVPALAARLRATIVAKGPGTFVAAPDGRVWVTPRGGPALGSGGTGDVLAGIIGAAIATADDVALATARAVWWHAAAGDRAGEQCAGRATATDLLAALPPTLHDLAQPRRAPNPGVFGGRTPRRAPHGPSGTNR